MSTRFIADRYIHRWPTSEARTWVEEFLTRAQQDKNVQSIIAIGSAVRKDVRSDDLDILVICSCVNSLSECAPIEIDLRAFNVECIEEKIEAGHDLLGWAVLFGKPLFDRKGCWCSIVDYWDGKVPLPDPAVAHSRAVATRRRMQEMREIGDDEAVVELEVAYLSHEARAILTESGVYPASRPELPDQLQSVGARKLAENLRLALETREDLRNHPIC